MVRVFVLFLHFSGVIIPDVSSFSNDDFLGQNVKGLLGRGHKGRTI